jgi:predicted acylesterase/phospholipase RssA
MAGLWQPHTVSFSSGGVRIIGHFGVMARLLEAGALGAVRNWYGCSGGSICAFLGALGVSPAWLSDCVENFNMSALGEISEELVTDYMNTWGVNTGESGMVLFGRFIDTWEAGASAWSFADLAAARPGIALGITATNVSRGKLVLFSAETTPDMRIMDAIHASCAIPLYFTPWVGEGDVFCDGAVMEQYPWSCVADKKLALVVVCSETAISGRERDRADMRDLRDYAARLVQIVRQKQVAAPLFWIAVNNKTVSVVDFDLDREGRMSLFGDGQRAAEGWLRFRQIAGSVRTAGTPPQNEGHCTLSSSHHAGSRMSGTHPPRKAGDSCPSHHPDTGAPLRSRRWSL